MLQEKYDDMTNCGMLYDEEQNHARSDHQAKDYRSPKNMDHKQFKLNTQKLVFQNFMNEDNIETFYPTSMTNKVKSTKGEYHNPHEEGTLNGSYENDEIDLIEKQMGKHPADTF